MRDKVTSLSTDHNVLKRKESRSAGIRTEGPSAYQPNTVLTARPNPGGGWQPCRMRPPQGPTVVSAQTATDQSGRGQAFSIRYFCVWGWQKLNKSNQVSCWFRSIYQFREKLIKKKNKKNEDVPLVVFISVALYLHACQVRVTAGDSGLCSVVLVLRISSADLLPCLFIIYYSAKLTTA